MGDAEQRGTGLRVDLDALEKQAEQLYLHRFVTAIKKARGEYGRYLILRAGDELAIRAADDGSSESLDDVSVDGHRP
ncbi:MAG TPA: hypothetical protein VHJ82_06855 [Actinomycetota bacterium]|nr:hypothetical protein [Actinomycetota bacterium]